MAIVLAIANQKGGVGKTASTLNLGAALAEVGKRTLLVDLDPQANLTAGVGVELAEEAATTYHSLFEAASAAEAVRELAWPRLSLLPSSIDLSGAELQLVSEMNRETVLRRVLAPVRGQYDFILIDCPPSLGLLTLNGLSAADGVIVPLQCGYWALRGIRLLLGTIDRVRESGLNGDLQLLGILLTMYDARTAVSTEVEERARAGFGKKVFTPVIRKTVRMEYASIAAQPIVYFDPSSAVAAAYRSVAKEVLKRAKES